MRTPLPLRAARGVARARVADSGGCARSATLGAGRGGGPDTASSFSPPPTARRPLSLPAPLRSSGAPVPAPKRRARGPRAGEPGALQPSSDSESADGRGTPIRSLRLRPLVPSPRRPLRGLLDTRETPFPGRRKGGEVLGLTRTSTARPTDSGETDPAHLRRRPSKSGRHERPASQVVSLVHPGRRLFYPRCSRPRGKRRSKESS